MTNKDKYKTSQERVKAYCIWECNFNEKLKRLKRFMEWLDLEAEEEKPLPCPFCGRKDRFHISVSHTEGAVMDCVCGYVTPKYPDYSSMVAAHNRVAKAVKESEGK